VASLDPSDLNVVRIPHTLLEVAHRHYRESTVKRSEIDQHIN